MPTPNTNTGAVVEGAIKIHAPSREGLTCTVEYPNGTTKEWKASTVAARGFEVPAVVPARRAFALTNSADGSAAPDVELIYAQDLRVGDKVNGEPEEVTAVAVEGRKVTFRLGRFRRTASTYQLIPVATS